LAAVEAEVILVLELGHLLGVVAGVAAHLQPQGLLEPQEPLDKVLLVVTVAHTTAEAVVALVLLVVAFLELATLALVALEPGRFQHGHPRHQLAQAVITLEAAAAVFLTAMAQAVLVVLAVVVLVARTTALRQRLILAVAVALAGITTQPKTAQTAGLEL
jgi:hypothetical protein